MGQDRHRVDALLRTEPLRRGQDGKGLRLQGIPGQDGQGLPIDLVAGGLAPAQIIVIHTGQVVMDQ